MRIVRLPRFVTVRLLAALTLSLSSVSLSFTVFSESAGASETPVLVPGAVADGAGVIDSAGNIYFVGLGANEVYKITPQGVETPFASVFQAGSIAISPQGVIYVGEYVNGFVYEFTTSGIPPIGVTNPVAQIPISSWALAVDSAGDIFSSAGPGNSVYETAAGVHHIGTEVSPYGGDGIYLDSAGDLYLSDATSVDELGPTFTLLQTVNLPSGARWFQIYVDNSGNIYGSDFNTGELDEISPSDVVTTIVDGGSPGALGNPVGLVFDSSGDAYISDISVGQVFEVSGALNYANSVPLPPLNLTTEQDGTEITATWTPRSPGATYLCTLLFGYNAPSTFNETTTSNTCTFSGLDKTLSYGVRVITEVSGRESLAVWSLADYTPPQAPVKKTIICVKKSVVKKVTGVSPKCPTGYRRK